MLRLREIRDSDDAALASIIRRSLDSYGLGIPGTVYTDPTTDALFELFRQPGSVYFVAEEDGRILGGCGIFPTKGLPEGHAELVKLYLELDQRGKGLGLALMVRCFDWARSAGHKKIYLETKAELTEALKLYRRLGFETLTCALGESGHHACEIRMLKTLGQFTTAHFDARSPLYQKSLAIREEVFIGEQKIDRRLELEHEDESIFFLTFLDGAAAATGRLRVVGDKLKFERIASALRYRGSGAARVLMGELVKFAQTNYPNLRLSMHAQLSAAGFYEKLGWRRDGDVFLEAEIPHVSMTLF